jgi:outer membrane protein assembly factor BamB
MPVVVPWNRREAENRRSSFSRWRPRNPTVLALLLMIVFAGSLILGLCPLLRERGRVGLHTAWEVDCPNRPVVSDTSILVYTGTGLSWLVDARTGEATSLPNPVPANASVTECGIAWIDGGTLFFTKPDGTVRSFSVPPDSAFLTAFELDGSTWLVIAHPRRADDGTWAGDWVVSCLSMQRATWSAYFAGTPVFARWGAAGLLVGVTDLASGPASSICLLSPRTGEVLWKRSLGTGLFREKHFLPSGEILVSWSSGVAVFSSQGDTLCRYEQAGAVISASSGGSGAYVVVESLHVPRNANLIAVAADASVRWQKEISAPAMVKVSGDTVICLEKRGIRAFLADSGAEIWYYQTGRSTAWLLDSGILCWDGHTLRLLTWQFLPGLTG